MTSSSAATLFGLLGKVAGFAGEDLDGFVRKQLTLAADMAAFAGEKPDQVMRDLISAYAGSYVTLRKYGVFLNEAELRAALGQSTGEEVTGVLTAQQRINAVQAGLLEQTTDMQGLAEVTP